MTGWRWLYGLHELLRRADVSVEWIRASEGVVTVRATAGNDSVDVELAPRDRGGPRFAAVGRHVIRYRAQANLDLPSRRVLETMLRVVARFEPHVPFGFAQSHAVGGGNAAQELRWRYPFAFVERSGGGEDGSIEVMIRTSRLCNQRCPFCIAPPVPEASPEAFLDCIEFACHQFPMARFTLTGGEPLLRNGFFDELACLLHRPEPVAVQVQTNAVLLADPGRVERIPRDPRLSFFVSLHGTTDAVYDACTGTTGNLNLAWQGIGNLLKCGHLVTLNCVANRFNAEHLVDYGRDVACRFGGNGALRVHFSVMMCPRSKPGGEGLMVRYSVLAPLLESATDAAATAGLGTEPLVSSTHASIPVCLVSKRQQVLRRNRPVLDEGETGYEDFSRQWVKAERCRSCSLTTSCLGVPAPYAMRFGLDELVPVIESPTAKAPVCGRDDRCLQGSKTAIGSTKPRVSRREALPMPERIEKLRPSGSPVACTRPWTTLEITEPRGSVRHCCADWVDGDLGTPGEVSLLEIWNGRKYQQARKTMASGTGTKCRPVCPRLHDRLHHEQRMQILDGPRVFVQNQIVAAEDIARRRTEVQALPLYLALCPSTYCNASCVMCQHWRQPKEDLPERVWEELPSLLPTLANLTLLGGEPLANSRVLEFLVDTDLETYPSLYVDLVTNGGLLSEDTLRRLRCAALGCVTVSLNAGTAEAYERVQTTLRFEDIVRSIDALLRFRDEHPRWFGVALSCVVQPDIVESLVEFGEIAVARSVDIRLLPLTVSAFPELDFYQSREQVACVVRELDRFASYANAVRPEWITEIEATKQAVLAEHAGRQRAG